MENWCREYICCKGKFILEYTKPLTEMINEEKWNDVRTQGFEDLKEATANVDPARKIYVAIDASKKGWGGILFYLKDDGAKDIGAVASGSFNETVQKWSTNEHEAKGIHNTFLAFSHTC